jgi:hypothetical protein
MDTIAEVTTTTVVGTNAETTAMIVAGTTAGVA